LETFSDETKRIPEKGLGFVDYVKSWIMAADDNSPTSDVEEAITVAPFSLHLRVGLDPTRLNEILSNLEFDEAVTSGMP